MTGALIGAACLIFNPVALIQIFLAACLGMIFGIIPGLAAALAVILLISISCGMDPATGISIPVGLHIGGLSGGLVPAVLPGRPRTPFSIAAAWDGFPLAKQGFGGRTLKAGVVSNLVGAAAGWLFLVALAPEIAAVALKFGSIEFVPVLIFGFAAVIALSGDSCLKGDYWLRSRFALTGRGWAFVNQMQAR